MAQEDAPREKDTEDIQVGPPQALYTSPRIDRRPRKSSIVLALERYVVFSQFSKVTFYGKVGTGTALKEILQQCVLSQKKVENVIMKNF